MTDKKGRLSQHTELKDDRWSVSSKKKLMASIKHKMKRIYVGILDALEVEDIDDEVFARIRSKVLNIGNDQIRNMELELQGRYNIEALTYHIDFKVLED